MSRCKSCHAEILWATTEPHGRPIPLDRLPDFVNGNIVLEGNPPTARILTTEDATRRAVLDGRPLYTTHFATCPNADGHRRPRTTTVEA